MTMKPTIDCGPPRAHPFSNKNAMEKQRFQNVVEMDNRLMLERLAKVWQPWFTSFFYLFSIVRDLVPIGLRMSIYTWCVQVVQNKSIDNEIHKSVAMHAQFKKKLGLTKKRLEMQKLTEENQRLLKRIQEVPPAYNHLKWEEDARVNKEIMKNMTLYPEFLEMREKEQEKKVNIEHVMNINSRSSGQCLS